MFIGFLEGFSSIITSDRPIEQHSLKLCNTFAWMVLPLTLNPSLRVGEGLESGSPAYKPGF
jgi:hypothetical protein